MPWLAASTLKQKRTFVAHRAESVAHRARTTGTYTRLDEMQIHAKVKLHVSYERRSPYIKCNQ